MHSNHFAKLENVEKERTKVAKCMKDGWPLFFSRFPLDEKTLVLSYDDRSDVYSNREIKRDSYSESLKLIDDFQFAHLIGTQKGKRPSVLDIGCAAGIETEKWILKMSDNEINPSRIVGIDFSPKMIGKAREINTTQNIEFSEGNLLEMIYDDEFDVARARYSVLSNVPIDKLPKALENIRKNLKENGTFYFDVLMDSPSRRAAKRKDGYPYLPRGKRNERRYLIYKVGEKSYGYAYLFRKGEPESFLIENGFKIEDSLYKNPRGTKLIYSMNMQGFIAKRV